MDKIKFTDIDGYLLEFSGETRERLEKIRATIKKAAPGATEKISYGMPTFYLHGNLVHFAAYKNHIGLYPTPSGIESFKKELSAYSTSKGGVQFPHDKRLPLTLIAKIVKFRIAKNAATVKLKKKK